MKWEMGRKEVKRMERGMYRIRIRRGDMGREGTERMDRKMDRIKARGTERD